MKGYAMKTVRNLILALGFFVTLGAHADAGVYDGMPVPWPFPWAKECPINWENLNGRYELTDSLGGSEVSLRISVVMHKGLRLVRVSRYARKGGIEYDGSTFVTENQKFIRLYLAPIRGEGPRIWATIKLHYQSEVMTCTADHLVPILSMRVGDDSADIDYKLTKLRN